MKTEHIHIQTSWSIPWDRLKTIEERNTMRYTWLKIATSPHAIRLIAEIPNDKDDQEVVNYFREIEKSPSTSERAAANLKHQLNYIRTHTDTPIFLQTIDEFMILNKFISFNDLVYMYEIHVVGYTSAALYEKVKVRDDLSRLSSLVPTHSGRYPWGDKSRQPITVDHIFYDDVATVVFWTDGTKTVVKCAEGTKYDEYAAFCIALAKKIYGNNSALKRAIKNHARYSKKRQIIKTLCGETSKDVRQGDTFVAVNDEDNKERTFKEEPINKKTKHSVEENKND